MNIYNVMLVLLIVMLFFMIIMAGVFGSDFSGYWATTIFLFLIVLFAKDCSDN